LKMVWVTKLAEPIDEELVLLPARKLDDYARFADLPGLSRRHRRCVRPQIPGLSPGGLGPHLTASGFPCGLSSGFPFARWVLPLRPPSSGFPLFGVLRLLPSAVTARFRFPFGFPAGSPSLEQSPR
jgi:hypothetical protein